MSTINTDYTNRTVDLLVLYQPKASGVTRVNLEFGNPTKVCTGIQKVVQTFTTLLLSNASDSSGLVFNSPFIVAAQRGILYNETNLRFYFNLAVSQILEYLSTQDATDIPNDEILSEAELTSFNMDPGYLSMNVRLTSAAGETRTVVMPVSVVTR